MVIASDNYAKFLHAFHKSLYSDEKPTSPLKMGNGMGYGQRFWGFGKDFHESNSVAEKGLTYASTSWRRSDPSRKIIDSVGCCGWLPGVFPTTDEHGAGWWMQFARNDVMTPACNGATRSWSALDRVVEAVIKAVKANRNAQGTQQNKSVFHAMHTILPSMQACSRCERETTSASAASSLLPHSRLIFIAAGQFIVSWDL